MKLCSLNPDKMPGSDGYPAGFFQSYWHIIGPDVDVVKKKISFGTLSTFINYTFIRLIFKTNKSTHLII